MTFVSNLAAACVAARLLPCHRASCPIQTVLRPSILRISPPGLLHAKTGSCTRHGWRAAFDSSPRGSQCSVLRLRVRPLRPRRSVQCHQDRLCSACVHFYTNETGRVVGPTLIIQPLLLCWVRTLCAQPNGERDLILTYRCESLS